MMRGLAGESSSEGSHRQAAKLNLIEPFQDFARTGRVFLFLERWGQGAAASVFAVFRCYNL